MRTLSLVVLAAACSRPVSPKTAAAELPPGPEPTTAASSLAVKPGLNDNFLADDLDVDQWVARFGAESREVVAQQGAILEAMGLELGQDVADIGAGTGLYLGPFATAVGSEGKVYAVDISPGFLEHLEGLAAASGWTQVRTVRATATSPELARESVDAIFICDTYHHFEHPMDTLAGLYAALRPGGRLFVVDFIREEGVSSDWILGHVRAGEEVVTAEIEAAGFTGRTSLEVGLSENYMLQFTKAE
jgi:SAM-dependent methyltransferase